MKASREREIKYFSSVKINNQDLIANFGTFSYLSLC